MISKTTEPIDKPTPKPHNIIFLFLSIFPSSCAYFKAIGIVLETVFPMFSILLSPEQYIESVVMVVGVLSLALLGALSSYVAGTSPLKGSLRVMLWGIIAMLFSSWIGSLFNITPL